MTIKVSISRIKMPGATQESDLDKCLDDIKRGKHAELIGEVRGGLVPKEVLLGFHPSGLFPANKNPKNSTLIQHSGYICLDYDHVEEAEKTRDKLAESPFCYAAFVSPSGNGVKVIVPITPIPTTPEGHAQAYNTVANLFPQEFRDLGTNDVVRRCFFSSDTDLRYGKGQRGGWGPTGLIEQALQWLNVDDYEDWYQAGAALKLDFGEIGRAIWMAWSATSPKFNSRLANDKWGSFTRTDKVLHCTHIIKRAYDNGMPKATIDSELIFEPNEAGIFNSLIGLGYEIRYNIGKSQAEFASATFPWQGIYENGLIKTIGAQLSTQVKWYKSKGGEVQTFHMDHTEPSILLASERYAPKLDPFIEWLLYGIPEWDNTPRMHRMFTDALGAADVAHIGDASHNLLIMLITRQLDRDNPASWHPIFVGPQGATKTAFAHLLLPKSMRRQYVSTSIDLKSDSAKEVVEKVQGRVIAELSEMESGAKYRGLYRRFVTDTYATVRLPYEARARDIDYRHIIIATANNDSGYGVLPDFADARRPKTVELPKPANEEAHFQYVQGWMDENRDQLYAEALAMFRAGHRGRLDHDLDTKWLTDNAQYEDTRLQDAREAVDVYLANFDAKKASTWRTTSELVVEVNTERYEDPLSRGYLTTALKAKCVSVKHNTGVLQRRVWFPIATTPTGE